jgi:hypothetical protein
MPPVPRNQPRYTRQVINLYRVDTDQLIGPISPADLQVLVDALEEESSEDRDYYVDAPTIELLAQNGASDAMLTMLRLALGTAEGLDVRWVEQS